MSQTMVYHRPPGARQNDHANSKEFEQTVGEALGPFKIDHSKSNDKLDFWCPGFFTEVKEKRQPISNRWPLPEGCAIEDAFILDELSIRKAADHYPFVWFVLRDYPNDRIFLAGIAEILCADRVRVNRVGPPPGNVAKGKWVLNLTQFRLLEDLSDITPTILGTIVALPWKQSACLIPTEVQE